MTREDLVGRTMTVEAEHAGHTVTVERRDEIEKHKAYWLRCSCGQATVVGERHLPTFVDRGLIPHSVFS